MTEESVVLVVKAVVGLVLLGTVGTVIWAVREEIKAIQKEYGDTEE